MNRLVWIVFICGLVLGVGRIALSRAAQLEAAVWHWRHGHSVRVREYEVPVPNGWMVSGGEGEPGGMTSLRFTRPTKDRGPIAGINEIMITSSSGHADLDFWKAYKRRRLEEEGLPIIEEKTIRVGGERVECLGGNEPRQMLHLPTVDLAIECVSSGRLALDFWGQPSMLGEFYTIASGIRKQQ